MGHLHSGAEFPVAGTFLISHSFAAGRLPLTTAESQSARTSVSVKDYCFMAFHIWGILSVHQNTRIMYLEMVKRSDIRVKLPEHLSHKGVFHGWTHRA